MTEFDHDFLRDLDIEVPEFELPPLSREFLRAQRRTPDEEITDEQLFEAMPPTEWRAIERAAQMMNEGLAPRAEGHRRDAGYGGLSEPPTTPED